MRATTFLLLLLAASIVGAERPPDRHTLMAYLKDKAHTTCGKPIEPLGNLAGGLMLACRSHASRPNHDWRQCADALVTAWCATN